MEVVKKYFYEKPRSSGGAVVFCLLLLILGIFVPLEFADAGWFDIGNIAGAAILSFFSFVLSFQVWVAAYLAGLAGSFMDWVLHWDMFYTKCTVAVPQEECFIDIAWKVMRNLVNAALIVALVIIALFTMLDSRQYGIKNAFVPLVLVALLVNFSRVLVGLVVDGANIIMDVFVQAMPSFADVTSMINATDVSIGGTGNFTVHADLALSNLLQIVVTIMFFLGLAFILALYGVLFAARYMILWILTIVSPIALAAYIFPSTRRFFNLWRDQLVQWSIIGIPVLALLWVALLFIMLIDKIPPPEEATGMEAFFLAIIPSLFALMLLFVAFIFGLQTGAMGSKVIINIGKKWGNKAMSTAKVWSKGTAGAAGRSARRKAEQKYGGRGEEVLEKMAAGRLARIPLLGGAVRRAAKGAAEKIRSSRELEKDKKEAEGMSENMRLAQLQTETDPYKWKALMEVQAKQDPRKVRKLMDEGKLSKDRVGAMVKNLSLSNNEKDIIDQLPEFAHMSRNIKDLDGEKDPKTGERKDEKFFELIEKEGYSEDEAKVAKSVASRSKEKAKLIESGSLRDKGVVAGIGLNPNVDTFDDLATSAEDVDNIKEGYKNRYGEDKMDEELAKGVKAKNIPNIGSLLERPSFRNAIARRPNKVDPGWFEKIADEHGEKAAQDLFKEFQSMTPGELMDDHSGLVQQSFASPAMQTLFGPDPLMSRKEFHRRRTEKQQATEAQRAAEEAQKAEEQERMRKFEEAMEEARRRKYAKEGAKKGAESVKEFRRKQQLRKLYKAGEPEIEEAERAEEEFELRAPERAEEGEAEKELTRFEKETKEKMAREEAKSRRREAKRRRKKLPKLIKQKESEAKMYREEAKKHRETAMEELEKITQELNTLQEEEAAAIARDEQEIAQEISQRREEAENRRRNKAATIRELDRRESTEEKERAENLTSLREELTQLKKGAERAEEEPGQFIKKMAKKVKKGRRKKRKKYRPEEMPAPETKPEEPEEPETPPEEPGAPPTPAPPQQPPPAQGAAGRQAGPRIVTRIKPTAEEQQRARAAEAEAARIAEEKKTKIAEEAEVEAPLEAGGPPEENLPEDQEKAKNKEQEFEAIIPRGWTTLKHGTNALNWGEINPYSSDRIKLEKPLSVISQEEFEQDKQAGGQYDTTKNYAEVARRPEGMSDNEYAEKNKPFEMRVVFYKNHARHHTDPEYSQGLDKKTMDQIAKYYFANIQGGRHPLVPKGETLVKIGQTQEGGKDVFYFVPESLAETYSSEAGVEIKESEKESAEGLNTED